ncbi:MAG: AAA family ATPase [Acidobacteriota bacterium]|nr:AAA family ATPase [Acidobacteriota bacterium]
MRLTYIYLQNWKNFSRIAVELEERAFVVGPNASGKSNLLDAFRFIRDVAVPEGGLQRAVTDRGGVEVVRFLGAAADAEVVVHVAMEEEDSTTWMYQLAFKSVQDGTAVLTRECVSKNGAALVNRPDEDDENDPRRLRQTSLEQVAANKSFRTVADFLAQISYLHLTPAFVRDRERIRPRAADPLGSDLLDRVVRTPKGALEKRMQRINTILRAALPELDRIVVEGGEGATPHLWIRFKDWRPTAGAQNERQLSDGTLRLFGFLWAVLDGDGPLLLEEPELSLHPGVVRHLASLICAKSSRQTIISTHSVDFLSDEGIAPEEVLLLTPTPEGTDVSPASDDAQIRALLEGGLSIGDAVLPSTAPPRSIDMLRAGPES